MTLAIRFVVALALIAAAFRVDITSALAADFFGHLFPLRRLQPIGPVGFVFGFVLRGIPSARLFHARTKYTRVFLYEARETFPRFRFDWRGFRNPRH